MSKELRVADYIEHILSAIDRINRHIAGVEMQQFISSELIQDAVIRNLEVIGEAANKLDKLGSDVKLVHSSQMISLRNRLIHAL